MANRLNIATEVVTVRSPLLDGSTKPAAHVAYAARVISAIIFSVCPKKTGLHVHLAVLVTRAIGKEPEPFWERTETLARRVRRRMPA